MQLSDAQTALLNSILTDWNQAEIDIKIAEQVCNNIVIPSIKELRYGGRRIVDAMTKIAAGGEMADIESLFHEARFDCLRARHDAIDAATSKIALDLEVMVKKLGYEVILPVYPNFPNLFHSLQSVRAKIAESRKDRENRETIYAVLEGLDFPNLINAFNKMRESEAIMKAIAKRRRRSELIGVVGAIFGLLGFLAAFYFWLHP